MILFLIGSATPSLACSIATPLGLTVDPLIDDAEAPLAPELVQVDIRRGSAPEERLFGQKSVSSCGDSGQIVIEVARPAGDIDDETTVGYRFALVEGVMPEGFELPARDAEPWLGPNLFLTWGDGQVDDQDAFAFTVEVFPVDAAGNEGEPLELEFADDGLAPGSPGGCSTTPLGGWWGLALAAPFLVRRRATAAARTGR